MPCWLCKPVTTHQKCGCCLFLDKLEEPVHKVPDVIVDHYNISCILPETSRLTQIYFISKQAFDKTKKQHIDKKPANETQRSKIFSSIDSVWNAPSVAKKRKVELDIYTNPYNVPSAAHKLVRFIKVIDLLYLKPSASICFDENHRIIKKLITTHLQLIVGKKEWNDHKSLLYSIIEVKNTVSSNTNLVWLTSRQQGKTQTLARFAIALVLMAPNGGNNLLYVYGTTLHRTQELCSEAKDYALWILRNENNIQEKFQELGLPGVPNIILDNNERFSIESWTSPGVPNMMRARPKNERSLRGDAFKAAYFDEAAFLEPLTWKKFAQPMLMVHDRVVTMATTPGPLNGFFDNLVKQIVANPGDTLYHFVNHNLMCDFCFDKEKDTCDHRLYLIPPWKCALRTEKMLKTVSLRDRKDFQAEVYGRRYNSQETYFPPKLVNYTLFEKQPIRSYNFGKLPIVYISVDPSSHTKSYMGMCALAKTIGGNTILLGATEIQIQRCEIAQLQMCVTHFVSRVVNNSALRKWSKHTINIIPIVECNNNEIVSKCITSTIIETASTLMCKYLMPFKAKEDFTGTITPDIGVWCTENAKLEGIHDLYELMFEGRFGIAKTMTTMGPMHLSSPQEPSRRSVVELLRDELVQFKDTDKGVTGKTVDTNDDLAMSIIQGVKWIKDITALAAKEDTFIFPH